MDETGKSLDEARLGVPLFLICLTAAMGGLLFGYDWVVIGGAKPFYEAWFGLSGAESVWRAGFAMSSAVFGCIVGALSLGWIPDCFGRKPALIWAAVFFTVSAVWTAVAVGYWDFVAARALGGLGIGLASNVSPVYIAEVSPARLRGRLVALNQLTLVIGILAAATLAIGLALATQLLDTPEEQAKKELAKIADDYYVEYVYPQLTEAGQKTEKLVDYATAGVPMTYLRQLLLYNNGEHQAQAGIFSAAGCDTNATGVRYYPVEPYGPHDYTASFVWQCDIME